MRCARRRCIPRGGRPLSNCTSTCPSRRDRRLRRRHPPPGAEGEEAETPDGFRTSRSERRRCGANAPVRTFSQRITFGASSAINHQPSPCGCSIRVILSEVCRSEESRICSLCHLSERCASRRTYAERFDWIARMKLAVEFDREEDGRWIAEVSELPGVLAYGKTRAQALAAVEALALRVIADRTESDGRSLP
jgi:predicted RNase H-like HicB family nuclease